MKSLFFLFIISFFVVSCAQKEKNNIPSQEPEKCIYKRAVINLDDIRANVQVARIDHCKAEIKSIEFQIDEKIDFKGNYTSSGEKKFSDSFMKESFEKIKILADKIKQFNPEGIQGVAIGVFRRAENAKPFIERMNIELGLNIQIITPVEESILGFYSAMKRSGIEKEKLVAWHIDWESQQFLAYEGFTQFNITQSKVGVSDLVQFIQKKILRRNIFPYNMSSYQQTLAENYIDQNLFKAPAKKYKRSRTRRARKFDIEEYSPAKKKVSLVEILAKPDVKVFGFGPLLFDHALKNVQIDPSMRLITIADLQKKISDIANTNSSDLSLLILMKASMDKLKLNSIEIVEIDLNEGLLLNGKYWGPLL